MALLIDELLYLKEKELSALIMAMHKMQQRQLPMVLIGAGLPILPRLTPTEKRFLRAMAGLGPGAHRSGDIAEALGVKINSLGPVRAKLIQKGMIFSPAHGDIAFTVPLFDGFLLRAIPEL